MTDFLSRLAERTLGLAPVVQPLVRPLSAPVFEPPPGPVAAVEVPELAAAPLAPARKPNPLARSRPLPEEPEAEQAGDGRHAEQQAPEAPPPEEVVVPGRESVAAPPGPAPARALPAASAPVERAAARRSSQTLEERPARPVAEPPPRRAPRPAHGLEPRLVQETTEPRRPRSSPREHERPLVSAPAPDGPALVPPRRRGRRSAEEAGEPGAAAPQEGPVQVTIGRVEIRPPAPAPPAEAPRPRWSPPFLSLDDYLERSAGRG